MSEVSVLPTISIADREDEVDLRQHVSSYSSYLDEALFGNRRRLIARARHELHDAGIEYDTLIGIGLSSSLVIPQLAEGLDCYWAIARKDLQNTHAYRRMEGRIGKKWILVDDFIASGKTAITVNEHVQKFAQEENWQTEFVGAYLYSDNEVCDRDDLIEKGIIRDSVLHTTRVAWKW